MDNSKELKIRGYCSYCKEDVYEDKPYVMYKDKKYCKECFNLIEEELMEYNSIFKNDE